MQKSHLIYSSYYSQFFLKEKCEELGFKNNFKDYLGNYVPSIIIYRKHQNYFHYSQECTKIPASIATSQYYAGGPNQSKKTRY